LRPSRIVAGVLSVELGINNFLFELGAGWFGCLKKKQQKKVQGFYRFCSWLYPIFKKPGFELNRLDFSREVY
jgi:hypothetical protein